jgi:hypothetical protein
MKLQINKVSFMSLSVSSAQAKIFTSPERSPKRQRLESKAASVAENVLAADAASCFHGRSPGEKRKRQAPNTHDRSESRIDAALQDIPKADRDAAESLIQKCRQSPETSGLTAKLQKFLNGLKRHQHKCYSVMRATLYQCDQVTAMASIQAKKSYDFPNPFISSKRSMNGCTPIKETTLRSVGDDTQPPCPLFDHHSERAALQEIPEKIQEMIQKLDLQETPKQSFLQFDIVTKMSSCPSCAHVFGVSSFDRIPARIQTLLQKDIKKDLPIVLCHQGLESYSQTKQSQGLPVAEFFCSRNIFQLIKKGSQLTSLDLEGPITKEQSPTSSPRP